jgi:hypothetical protein
MAAHQGYIDIIRAPDRHGGLGSNYQKGVGTDNSYMGCFSVTLTPSSGSIAMDDG